MTTTTFFCAVGIVQSVSSSPVSSTASPAVIVTQYSFSDDAKLLGAPVGHTLHIRQVRLNAGAGFVVAFAGDIIAMPGLPKVPAAEAIDVDENGEIVGLF